MKKLLLTLTMVAALCYPHVKATQTIVKPGDATLSIALASASSGDTLVLKNDSAYRELDTLVIKMKITIKAQRLRKLPGLDGMPHLYNDGKIDPFFKLYSNADLNLIGIDVDNRTSMDIIRAADKDSSDGVFSLTIDRCRLHNCLFTEKDKGGLIGYPGDKMVVKYKKNLKKFSITNSIVYDMGGRSCYFKNWTGAGIVVIENCTFYNIGQQSFYVKWLNDGANTVKENLTFSYNHNTNYLISSNLGYPKEIMGNATGQTYVSTFTGYNPKPLAPFVANVKNSIFVKQVSTAISTLTGQPTSMGNGTDLLTNDIKILKNIFVGSTMQTASVTGLTITESSDVYPNFADSAARNFTVNNTAISNLADDNKTLGALYWDKNFKDLAVIGNANLMEIKIGDNVLPKFSAAVISYDVELSVGTTTAPKVSVTLDDDKASVVVTQAASAPGAATIVVTAQDGTTKKTYTINFKVATSLSKIADLAGIQFDGANVANFNANTLNYSVGLPDDQIDIPVITATKGDARETVVITQAKDLPGVATIKVTSEDQSVVKTYTVNLVLGVYIPSTQFLASASVYPNPIVENGSISFNLKTASNVQVDIIGLNGQLIQNLIKSHKDAGDYNVAFNASQLANGVYIIKFSANGTANYLKLIKR